ncbi:MULTISPECIES: hypothetical protein [Glaesserella]|uniref:Uncharacterized protein n=1 Tax=Glaesserella australis TaxID=2094024 RepID=A0A328BVX2_9PAST|nr:MULTISPECIES: hypothetical protein [Glaesserella]AUI65196.1 hypothetical protein CJD39_00780 [Glaesserella sp. 15-184]RAL18468.1 hypothetical protein C5N92_07070 [Glaesserella australis]
MSRRKQKQTNSEKLDLILGGLNELNDKVDKQNEEIERLHREIQATNRLVNEIAQKNRKQAIIAGGVGGGLVAVGFELLRMKFGM